MVTNVESWHFKTSSETLSSADAQAYALALVEQLNEARTAKDRAGVGRALYLRKIAMCALARVPFAASARSAVEQAVANLPDRVVGPYFFSLDWAVAHESLWVDRLSGLAGKRGLKVLEVGCYEGQTSCWLLDNLLSGDGAQLTCVDTFDDSDDFFGAYRDTFFANLRATGREDAVVVDDRPSSSALRTLSGTFDLIYLDGRHDAAGVLEDLVLSAPALEIDGVLILDDVDAPGFPGVRTALEAFLSCSTLLQVELTAHNQVWLRR